MKPIPYIFPQEPVVKNEDRTLGLVCCPAGQLFAKARIDRSAYCPGEEVKITGHVSNQSSKQVTATEVQLIQKVVFKAPHGKRATSLSVFLYFSDMRSSGGTQGIHSLAPFEPLNESNPSPVNAVFGHDLISSSYS